MSIISDVWSKLYSYRQLRVVTFGLLLICIVQLINCTQRENTMSIPNEVAAPDRSSLSPSGSYILEIIEVLENRVPMQYFQISNKKTDLQYVSDHKFDIRHTTYFLWGTEDRVWVYSGDVGTYFWENDIGTGEWEQFVYAQSEVSAPEFLKTQRPKQHLR